MDCRASSALSTLLTRTYLSCYKLPSIGAQSAYSPPVKGVLPYVSYGLAGRGGWTPSAQSGGRGAAFPLPQPFEIEIVNDKYWVISNGNRQRKHAVKRGEGGANGVQRSLEDP